MKILRLLCFILFVAVSCESSIQDDQMTIDAAVALDNLETANCYIVSDAGTYSFEAVKGNSREHVGQVATVEVLWETFGYSLRPQKGDLVRDVIYDSDRVYFRTAKSFKEGNAVIAVRDADGNILWSWHIWMTDMPEAQEYPNNAGVMMDRNLGATSTGHGHALALGLLYQWGRKDPFLNRMHIDKPMLAQSTITWPAPVVCTPEVGTVDFATKNPTTFIYIGDLGDDWHYVKDRTRWQANKTQYDPCPPGWRVPDGGQNGFWDRAGFTDNVPYDDVKMGSPLDLGNSVISWYPHTGYRYHSQHVEPVINYDGEGFYWTCVASGDLAFHMRLFKQWIDPHMMSKPAMGYAVRCQQD